MKRFKRLIAMACCVATLATSATVVGCGGSDSTALKIGYLNAGYGEAWIKQIAADYTAKTGVEIELDGDAQFSSKVTTELGSGSTDYDIIISSSEAWAGFAANGALANLDSVMASSDSNGNILESRYDANALPYGQAIGPNRKQGYYAIPFDSSIGGLVYNVEMFEYYGWQVPTTVSELVTLCNRIKSDTAKRKWTTKDGKQVQVAPFVYPGQYSHYWDFVIHNWWLQYDGVDQVNASYNPESKSALLTEGMKQAMKAFESLNIKSGANSNSLEGSESKDHITANINFGTGYAAMMPSGNWAETETKKNMEDPYEMAIIPQIYIDANHKTNAVYCVGVGYVFVPSASDNVSGAKAFIEYMMQPEVLQKITLLSGQFFALDYDVENIKNQASEFVGNVIDIRNSSTIIYPTSNHPLIKYGITYPWGLGSPAKLLLSGSYSDYTVVYDVMKNHIDTNWDRWQQKVNDYLG